MKAMTTSGAVQGGGGSVREACGRGWARCRRGFALPATLLAMVVLAGLIMGGVFMSAQGTRAAVSEDHSTEAFLASERGLARAVGGFTRADYWAIPVDSTVELARATQLSGDLETEYVVRVRSLGNNLYFVESTGRVTGGGRYAGAAHRSGMMVRPTTASFEVESALKTLGAVEVSGTGYVSGVDNAPSGWSGCLTGPAKPGIISSAESYTKGAGGVDGDPDFVEDDDLSPGEILNFGGMTYDDLVAKADYHVSFGTLSPSPSVDDDGFCDTDDEDNWGATSGPCSSHFPIIHVQGAGASKLHSYAQGILLVDGDFKANGGGRFNGIAIVKGQLLNGGGNGGVTGAIIVYNDGDTDETYKINGNGVALYSSCAVARAEEALSRIAPIAERSWVDLSGAGAAVY